MPPVAIDRLSLPIRLAAIGILVVNAIAWVPEPGGEAIQAMVQEAEDLAHFEAFVPAMAKLEPALRAAERLADSRLTALCLDRIGSVLDFEGQPAAGAVRHQRALALANQISDHRLAASIRASIGLAHWRQSEYGAALGALHDALAVQEKLRDDTGRARTLDFIGRVHFKKAEYTQAKESYRRAVAILETSGDRRWLAITLEDLGDLALEQGFYTDALDTYERALVARREVGDSAGEGYGLYLIGRAYLRQGAYREALVWFERVLDLSRASDDRSVQALALYHMGIAHRGLADPVEALEFYSEALALKEELGDRRQQAWILLRMGDVHADQQDFPSALERYGRAIRIWEEIRDPRGVATGLDKAAGVEFKLGRYAESLELFRRTAEILATSQPAFLASALAGMGEAYAAAGDEVRALEHGRRAEELARRGRNDEVRWAIARSMGSIARRLGHREDALNSYLESLAIIETLRGRLVASSDVRAGFLEGKQAVYAETVELLIELGRFEEALEVAERARARAFLDLLSGRELVTKPADRAALARIASLQEELRREAAPAPSAGPAALGDRDRGEKLRSELTALTAARPELASLVTTPALTLRQTRSESRRAGTILEYFSANDRLFIWVVASDGSIRAASSQISRRELSDLVGAVRGSLRADAASRSDALPSAEPVSRDAVDERRGPRSGRGGGSDSRLLLRRLHRVLIEPVSHLLPRDRNQLITIVPHGPLFLISFAALVDGKGQYFVERHTLAYSPSISVLRYTGRNRDRAMGSTTPQLLVVGNPAMPKPAGREQPLAPLPGAESEARTIAGFYPSSRVSALTGSRAGERTVRELAPGQTIIHLATHAVVFDDEPMSSYLALAPEVDPGSGARDPLGDGLLTVAEVFGLDLHAELVTLSACNTGLGRVSGEGVVGLSRAFIYAGTASVLVSLWGVADTVATKEMEYFYRGLIRTRGNKAEALAAAQREMIALLRAGKLQSPSGRALAEDPLLWAPFVLVGEAR